MKKFTIEAIIGIITGTLLLCLLAHLTADDPAEYGLGASIGFTLGVVLIVCVHNREEKRKNK